MKIKLLIAYIFAHFVSFSQGDTIFENKEISCDTNISSSKSHNDTSFVGKVKSYVHGKASYYAGKFIGRKTANGEIFTSNDLTCAHMYYKFGTRLRVTNVKNGKSIIVRVNDRGGFSKYGRIVDLSKAAFKRIASTKSGVINVKIEKIGKA